MSALMHDIRFGFRMMKKSWGVTAFAVLALAIGIGANTALFTVIHGVLLSPLPFPNAERLIFTMETSKGQLNSVSGPNFLDWQKQNTVFEELCAIRGMLKVSLTGDGPPVSLGGFQVSVNFFETLLGKPMLGRGFVPEEALTGNGQVIVFSHRFWQERYGADPGIVNRKITIDGTPYTVIGVAGATMGFLEDLTQFYVPLATDTMKQYRGDHYLQAIGRLKVGVTMEQAQAEMSAIAARLSQAYPGDNKDAGVSLMPMHEALLQEIRPAFFVLYGAVGFLLSIACVNVANLLLAKSGARSKEIAIRYSLGANRFRIFRQVLTESVTLALIGGGFGLLLAFWGLDLIRLIAPKLSWNVNGSIPGFDELRLDPTILGFTVFLSILTGLLFGLAPAWQASSSRINEMLKESGRGVAGSFVRHRILGGLVVMEMALAMILLIGAGLLIKSFYIIQSEGPGFKADRILSLEIERPRNSANAENRSRAAFGKQTIEKIAAIPGVESVAVINIPPLNGTNSNSSFTIIGRPPLPEGVFISAEERKISSDYFKLMNIPLLQGRCFTERDDETNPHVAIVNKAFVEKYFPGENPIGQRILLRDVEQEIVGVAGNVKMRTINPDKIVPFMYEPVNQKCWHEMTFMVKTRGNPLLLTDAVRQAIWSIDPLQPIARIQTMKQVVGNSVSVERFCMILLCLMAGVALVLALIGIYGVMAYSVYERTHEIGIRIAMGAQMADIVRMILAKSLMLTGIGILAGVVGALALTRFLNALLYKINANDPLTFVLVPFILAATALLACYLPARRASKVDPIVTLRHE